MIVLNYLLALSLLILSSAKTLELFLLADQKLEKTQNAFVKKTQATHQNERGSLSLVAALITLALSGLLLFYLKKMKVEYNEALYRKDSYLCFHYLNAETSSYVKVMNRFNWSLRSAFIAMNSGLAEAIPVFKGLVLARNGAHLLHLKKLATNNYCKNFESLSYLNNLPYETNSYALLSTNIDETTKLRNEKWSTIYQKIPRGIRLQKTFCLKANFSLPSAFSEKLTIKTSEERLTDLSNLKCFFGSSS